MVNIKVVVECCISNYSGGSMDKPAQTRTTYCSNCGAEREVRITVPWQDDICLGCGGSVEGG